MSLQIEIVQSEKDERDLIDFLLQHEALFAVPRLFLSNAFEPKQLGEETSPEQAIFRHADIDLVRNSIRPVVGRSGYSLILTTLGISIEWTRTTRSGTFGYHRGRFFLEYETPVSHDTVVALNGVMTALVRYIKKTSPKKSAERYPFYVGPDLARMVDRGEGSVVWGNGEVADLIANT
jgi:hypothetical protein